jgi:hypothetical protein
MSARREPPLTPDEKRARDRRYRHVSNHKKNNLAARAHNRAARLAAQWVQDKHPDRWKALVAEARQIEEDNLTKYVPHHVRFGGRQCPHDHLEAIGITTKCTDCGQIIGTVAVTIEENRQLLQEMLEEEA